MNKNNLPTKRLPPWLRRNIISLEGTKEVRHILKTYSLHTVCESAACPNKGECFGKKTATFLILGNICTRKCRFCNITKGSPLPVDSEEPQKIASAAADLKLKHVVITSVTRDDLKDKGAGHFALTIKAIKKMNSKVTVEVLTPDFMGDIDCLKIVLDANPDIFNHNLETVPRLYKDVRVGADYQRSLNLLKMSKELVVGQPSRLTQLEPSIITKSGLILGLGEKKEEIIEVLYDLKQVGCDIITIGQYMQPSLKHFPVQRYLLPEEFEELRKEGEKIGFKYVFSGPLVRSSYLADTVIKFT